MNKTWIVEMSELFPDGEKIADFVEKKGGRVERVPDFRNHIFRNLDLPIGYGSVNFIMQMLRLPQTTEGVFDHYQSLRCSSYYHCVYDLLKSKRILLPYGALSSAMKYVRDIFGEQVFIRPDSAIKEFDGEVIKTDELEKEINLDSLSRFHRANDGLVVLSEVVNFDKEYRIFCRNGEVVCSSQYKPIINDNTPKNILVFAEMVAKRLVRRTGIHIIAIDIGVDESPLHSHEFEDPSCRLIEINGVNSAGIYNSNVGSFVDMMEAEALFVRNSFLE